MATLLENFLAGQQGRQEFDTNALVQQLQQQGSRPTEGQLGQLAALDPKRAQGLQNLFQGIDSNNASQLAQSTLIAFSLDGPQRQQFMQRKLESIPQGTQFRGEFERIMGLPEEEQDEELFKGIQAFRGVGMLPRDQQGKTSAQIDRELGIRESQVASQVAETERKAGQLTPTVQKILDRSQQSAFESGEAARGLELLAKDINQADIGGGVTATGSELLKQFAGTEDDVSRLRRRFRAIRASQATENLPPGVASDKDIALALSGFPGENANAGQITSFLKGQSKLARIQEAFETFRSELISEQKSTQGLLKKWKTQLRDKDFINGLITPVDALSDVQSEVPNQVGRFTVEVVN